MILFVYDLPILVTTGCNIRKIDQAQAKEMAQKLDAKGGKQGNAWDDGVHENVRKVYLGKGPDCIAFVKFEYVDGTNVVIGDEHGEKTQEVEEVLIIYTI